MTEVRRITLWGRISRFPWGEGVLWSLFLLSGLAGLSGGGSAQITFSGIAALAAIGVRATRTVRSEAPDAQG